MDDFRICLFTHTSGETVMHIADVAALPAEQRAFFRSANQYSSIQCLVGGELREYMAFGPLDLLVGQLTPTAERVAAGLPALLRSGACDTITGTHWFFEPAPNEHVTVSLLATDHSPESHLSPLPYESPEAQQLYAFVARERDAMIKDGIRFGGYEPYVTPREALVGALQREARVGQQLLADFGRPLW